MSLHTLFEKSKRTLRARLKRFVGSSPHFADCPQPFPKGTQHTIPTYQDYPGLPGLSREEREGKSCVDLRYYYTPKDSPSLYEQL
jgi:hypothetical protein